MAAQVKAVLNVFSEGKAGRWPMPVFPDSPIIGIYSSPFVAQLMWQAFQKLADDKQGIEKMRKAYVYPSRLARTPHLYPQRALWSLTKQEKTEFGDIVATILSGIYQQSMFCENDSNIIYAKNEISNLINKNKKYFLENNFQLLKRLSGILWMLVESFFPRWHNTFHEYSGPYEVEGKKILLKEFHNLKPYYLPKENILYPFENITIIEEYQTEAKFNFDIHNRVSYGEKNETLLTRYAILVDGQPQKIDNLPKLLEQLQGALQKCVKHLQSMNKEQMIIFNGQGEYYALVHPLTKIVNIPNDLPSEFYERAKRPEITPEEQKVWDWIKNSPKNEAGFKHLFDIKSEM